MNGLYYGVLFGSINSLKELIDSGEDVNAKNKNGESPIHWAVFSHDEEKVKFSKIKLLINAGADVNVKDNFGKTPMCYLKNIKKDLFNYISEENKKYLRCNMMIELLKQHGAK